MILGSIFGGGASARPESKPAQPPAPAEEPKPKAAEPSGGNSSSTAPAPQSASAPPAEPRTTAAAQPRSPAPAEQAPRGDDARRGDVAGALTALATPPAEDPDLAGARALAEAAVEANRRAAVIERTATVAVPSVAIETAPGSVDGGTGPTLARDVATIRAMDAPPAERAVDRQV